MYVNSELVQYREKDALTWCEPSVPVVSVLFSAAGGLAENLLADLIVGQVMHQPGAPRGRNTCRNPRKTHS